jgi:hypothetical protein
MLDSRTIVYTVLALIPNLILMLLVLARIARRQRLLTYKVESVERELKLIDSALKDLGERLAEQGGIGRAPSGALPEEPAPPAP